MVVFDSMSDMQDSSDSYGRSAGQQHAVVLQLLNADREACLQSLAALEVLPGVRRVLLDEAGHALVVRGTTRSAELRRALAAIQVKSTIVRPSGARLRVHGLDYAALALLVLAVQIVLVWWSFNIEWTMLQATHAGASAFVVAILGAPLLRRAAAWLTKFNFSVELAQILSAACAWFAGALSAIRLEESSQPYFVLATGIVAFGLFSQAISSASRVRAGQRLKRMLHLVPDDAMAETRQGLQSVATSSLRPGRVVHVDSGRRFPQDGVIISGTGDVDESAVTGASAPNWCDIGDSVLAGSINNGEPRRVEVISRTRSAAVSLLARLAVDQEPVRTLSRGRHDRVFVWIFAAIVAVALITVGVEWAEYGDKSTVFEAGLLIVALGTPAGFLIAGPLSYVLTVAILRRWGIWVRDPSAI